MISSGLEAARLRGELGGHFLIVSPGIRPVENRPADDQKRTVDVRDAFLGGADYIVVGRPIRQAPDPSRQGAGDPGHDRGALSGLTQRQLRSPAWYGIGLIPSCRQSATSTMEYWGVPMNGSVACSSLAPSAAAA